MKKTDDNSLVAVLRHYGEPLTRDDYLSLHFGGEVPEEIDPEEEEAEFPEQFRRVTLIETPPASDKVQ